MTQACEEKLISDVSETKALLQQFMKEIKPTLATKDEVKAVVCTIDDHIENHKDARGLVPVWLGLALTAVLSVVGLFYKGAR